MPMLWSLFGFEIKMVVTLFPRCSNVLVLRVVLYIFVKYLRASDPGCFRCLMLPSGPFLLF